MKTLIALSVLSIISLSSYASQEGVLVFSNFQIESLGIGSSGKIFIEGKQDDKAEITSLNIHAFGKTYSVPEMELKKLTTFKTNGILLSYEGGYEEFGGRTVYIQLQTGFSSSTEKLLLISVNESGVIRVSDAKDTYPKTSGHPEKDITAAIEQSKAYAKKEKIDVTGYFIQKAEYKNQHQEPALQFWEITFTKLTKVKGGYFIVRIYHDGRTEHGFGE